MNKYSYGGYSAYNVAFGTIPDIIHYIHYTLWDPVYYYDPEENHPRNNKHLICGSESNSITL